MGWARAPRHAGAPTRGRGQPCPGRQCHLAAGPPAPATPSPHQGFQIAVGAEELQGRAPGAGWAGPAGGPPGPWPCEMCVFQQRPKTWPFQQTKPGTHTHTHTKHGGQLEPCLSALLAWLLTRVGTATDPRQPPQAAPHMGSSHSAHGGWGLSAEPQPPRHGACPPGHWTLSLQSADPPGAQEWPLARKSYAGGG